MQKIIVQDLCGDEETAKKEAKYTWQKGEIAWYFCTNYRDVFKVEFTGERWISGNKWRYEKIYQYKYLECSGDHDLNSKGLEDDGISHGEEGLFYSTKEEALARGFMCIKTIKNYALETFEKDLNRLKEYKKNNQITNG